MEFLKKLREKTIALIEKIGVYHAIHFLISGWFITIGLTISIPMGFAFFITIMLAYVLKEKFLNEKFDLMNVFAGIFGGLFAFLLYTPISIYNTGI